MKLDFDLPQKAKRYPVRAIWIFLGMWLLINLLQAGTTELFDDEAYFWSWSQNLDWGYWDHAPAIALVSGLGSWLIPHSELGARLFVVLLDLLPMGVIFYLSDRRDPWLIIMMLAGSAAAHIGGFFVAPDAPMGVALALFFVAYRRFCRSDQLWNAVLLGLAAALVLYSKYHGAMAIFFAMIVYPRWFLQRKFWLAVLVGLVVFLPGLHWLYENDFATFRHHLVDRNPEHYHIGLTLEYILGQFGMYGPLVTLVMIPVAFLYKSRDLFERGLKAAVVGILLFLLLMSFNGRVEPNWSAAMFIPLNLIAYLYLQDHLRARRMLLILAGISLPLLLLARVYLSVYDQEPLPGRTDFGGSEIWARELQREANGRPVVFFKSYQQPAQYLFYTGETAWSLNSIGYHRTQYDLWDTELGLQGEEVLLMSDVHFPGFDTFRVSNQPGRPYFISTIEDFRSWNKIEIEWLTDRREFAPGEETVIELELVNPYPYPVDFGPPDAYDFYLGYSIQEMQNSMEFVPHALALDSLRFDDRQRLEVPIRFPDEPGSYRVIFSIYTDWKYPMFGINGKYVQVTIENG